MFKVMCIRDSHKPNEIPSSHWVKKGQIYTVIEMNKMNQQNKLLGFKLEEIDLTSFFPYIYFSSDRFNNLNQRVNFDFYNFEMHVCLLPTAALFLNC